MKKMMMVILYHHFYNLKIKQDYFMITKYSEKKNY